MQNKIIYSQNFKNWFGDWENNPMASSKVVDSDGKPLIVHHASDEVFDEFDTKKIGGHGTRYGQGFYFTPDEEFAAHFGNNIKHFYLNIRKPLSRDKHIISLKEIKKLIDEIDKIGASLDNDFPYGILSDYGDIESENREVILNNAAELEYNSSDNDVEIIGSLINASGNYELVINTLHKLFGYDGIIDEMNSIYVAHSPSQIKEISNKTFSSDSKNMYESSKLKKTVFITESQLQQIKLFEETNFFVNPEKVIIIKKFLDKMFTRGTMDSLSSDGYPVTKNIIAMKDNKGKVIKNMTFTQVLDLLEDKFHFVYTDKEKRQKFLKQVLKDWYYKKISNEGLLSKNLF